MQSRQPFIVSSAIAWMATVLAGSAGYAVALGLAMVLAVSHDDRHHGVIELISFFGFGTIWYSLIFLFQATLCIGLTAPVQILTLALVRRSSPIWFFAALCATALSALATAYLFDYAVPQIRAGIDDIRIGFMASRSSVTRTRWYSRVPYS